MSDHKSGLISLESWSYNSPELRFVGKRIDVGLLAEALLYYDSLYVNVANQPQFAELISWFVDQGQYQTFLSLIESEAIKIYDYSFASVAVKLPNGKYDLVNIQDEVQIKPNSFEQRFLYHPDVEKVLQNTRQRNRLHMALRDRVIEVKASEYGASIREASDDFTVPERCSLVLQAFIDELYAIRGLPDPPVVNASSQVNTDGSRTIQYGIRLDALGQLSGQIGFHAGAPLTAAAVGNRLIWSASRLNCDLYLGSPMSLLVGDKLYESTLDLQEPQALMDELHARVEFPSIRQLVNDGTLGIADLMTIRANAKRFRSWLQQEADRDRDAIIAYHLEVARESGLEAAGRKTLALFGSVGGSVTGSLVGAAVGGPLGVPVGAMAGAGVGFVADIASKFRSGWRPVVFGKWLQDRIERIARSSAQTRSP